MDVGQHETTKIQDKRLPLLVDMIHHLIEGKDKLFEISSLFQLNDCK